MATSEPLGILAGGGTLPGELAAAVNAAGRPVHIVAISGEAGAAITPYPHTVVIWGQIGAILTAFRVNRCREILIIGSVNRPDLGRIRPDFGFFRALPTVLRIKRAGGDDSTLRTVVRFFESEGFTVVGVGDVAPRLMAPEGVLVAGRASGASWQAGATIGFGAISALAPFDLGQAVIVAGNRVVAVEGAEGTDRLLARAAGPGGDASSVTDQLRLLVKAPKPGQEMRVDAPVIGPATATKAAACAIDGIVVAAGRVILADRTALVEEASRHGLLVAGVAIPPSPAIASSRATSITAQRAVLRQATRRAPDAEARASAARGVALLQVAVALAIGGAAVVVRNHVLALECGEGVSAMLERSATLRQWGDQRGRRARRRGVAIFAERALTGADPAALVAALADQGLAGLCIVSAGEPGDTAERLTRLADHNGLFAVYARGLMGDARDHGDVA